MKSNDLLMDIHHTQAAIEQAKKSYREGGIPIGSTLAVDGVLRALGHNRRVQSNHPVAHAEMDCIGNAGRLKPSEYQQAVLYTTLAPCWMCTGTILLYRIPRVVIADQELFAGARELVEAYNAKAGNQITLEFVEAPELQTEIESLRGMLREFSERDPHTWDEDIGGRFHQPD